MKLVALVCCAGALALSGLTQTAFALFAPSVATSGPQTVSAATLAPPTSVGAGLVLCVTSAPAAGVTLTWTGSTSAFATGYKILRGTSSSGPFTTIATVGAGARTYSDTAVAFLSLYTYVIQTTYRNWVSTVSNSVTILTIGPLCL